LPLIIKSCLVIQWNSLKTSLVKKISRLRSQDKKAPKFSHLINITGYPFNTFPHKKISCLRSNKFHDETIFYPFNTFSVSKSWGISPSFFSFCFQNAAFEWRGQGHFRHVSHSTMTQPYGRHGGVVSSTMQRLQWVTPHYSVSCHDNRETVSGSQKPILAVSWPAWACTWQRFAASAAWDMVETKAANNIWRSLGARWRESHIAGGWRFDAR
jgi:hypothetical protein